MPRPKGARAHGPHPTSPKVAVSPKTPLGQSSTLVSRPSVSFSPRDRVHAVARNGNGKRAGPGPHETLPGSSGFGVGSEDVGVPVGGKDGGRNGGVDVGAPVGEAVTQSDDRPGQLPAGSRP